jgi:creatinine amidohydrolase/Fe(II)-dependent formamide hydrolase-like protein
LFKHLVKKERASETKVKDRLGPFQITGVNHIGPAEFAWDTLDLTDSGIFGPAGETITPSTASEEAGKKMLEPFIEGVCKFIEALKKANVEELLGRPQ